MQKNTARLLTVPTRRHGVLPEKMKQNDSFLVQTRHRTICYLPEIKSHVANGLAKGRRKPTTAHTLKLAKMAATYALNYKICHKQVNAVFKQT